MSRETLLGEAVNVQGEKFGRLTAIRRVPILNAKGKLVSYWECQCDCQNIVTVSLSNLRCGNTSSCGCLHKEAMERRRKLKSQHPAEYAVWSSMKDRCKNPNNRSYPDYGGRGIKVCDEWMKSFESFITHVGPRPRKGMQLDREDNDGNYEPGNVRWVTSKQNCANRRTTVNVTIDGVTKCISEWAEELGVSADMIQQRIRRLGWDPVDAVLKPSRFSK